MSNAKTQTHTLRSKSPKRECEWGFSVLDLHFDLNLPSLDRETETNDVLECEGEKTDCQNKDTKNRKKKISRLKNRGEEKLKN